MPELKICAANVFSQFKNIIKILITAVIWWNDKHWSKNTSFVLKVLETLDWDSSCLFALWNENAVHFVYKRRFLFCVLNALRYWCTELAPVDVPSVFFKINFSICHLLLCNHWTEFFKVPALNLFPSKSDLFLICKDTDERTNAHQNMQYPLRLFLRLLFRIWNFSFKTLTLDVLFLK